MLFLFPLRTGGREPSALGLKGSTEISEYLTKAILKKLSLDIDGGTRVTTGK
jgi:hypothetical protein